MRSRGRRLRYVGRVTIDQVDYYALEATTGNVLVTTIVRSITVNPPRGVTLFQ
jgi:hypothetical protein